MKQLFKYNDLIFELTLRDLKLQHRKPFFGFLWMLIIPFCTAIIYKVLFSDFFHSASGRYPFFIHLITALLPWNYFVSSIQRANRCILDSKNIISQVSFPKLLLPVSAVLVNLINFLPTLLVLVLFLAAFRVKLTVLILFLPAVILIHTCLIIGLAFLVSSLQVIYRDTEYVIQIMLMALFFLTPGVYTLEELISKSGSSFVKIYMLNPLVGIMNLYRIVFIGDYLSMLPKGVSFFNTFINPILWSLGFLFIGYSVFHKYEKRFLDHLNF